MEVPQKIRGRGFRSLRLGTRDTLSFKTFFFSHLFVSFTLT